jgi:hypothetical protein
MQNKEVWAILFIARFLNNFYYDLYYEGATELYSMWYWYFNINDIKNDLPTETINILNKFDKVFGECVVNEKWIVKGTDIIHQRYKTIFDEVIHEYFNLPLVLKITTKKELDKEQQKKIEWLWVDKDHYINWKKRIIALLKKQWKENLIDELI